MLVSRNAEAVAANGVADGIAAPQQFAAIIQSKNRSE
jgi:hypothetical protein